MTPVPAGPRLPAMRGPLSFSITNSGSLLSLKLLFYPAVLSVSASGSLLPLQIFKCSGFPALAAWRGSYKLAYTSNMKKLEQIPVP